MKSILIPLRTVSANSASPASMFLYFSAAAASLPLALVAAAAATLSAETIPLRASTAITSGLREEDKVGVAKVAFATSAAEEMAEDPTDRGGGRGGGICYTIQSLSSRKQGYFLRKLGLTNQSPFHIYRDGLKSGPNLLSRS